jgi:hypothetical protein
LVFDVIYCFGIKSGVGAGSLPTFFHLLCLNQHIGCSPNALRTIEVQVKAKAQYLSGLHRSGRGFTERTLKVLMIAYKIAEDSLTAAKQLLKLSQCPNLWLTH